MISKLKKYYINNITASEQIVTLYGETSCGVFEAISDYSQVIPANTLTEIKFPEDGIYQVYLDGVLEGNAKYFYSLFTSMIVFVKAALCGFSGSNCIELSSCATEDLNYINNALSKTILYTSVNNPTYDDSTIVALTKIRCSTEEERDKIIKQEGYAGISNTGLLSKIELAHFYLEMYAVDALVEDPGDIAELKVIYDYDNITYCIQKLGVMDCSAPPVLPGLSHERSLTVNPTSIGIGSPTDITLSYRFIANDDIFDAVIDTNIPNVTINKFDGFTYNEVIVGETAAKSYYITYSYYAGSTLLQNTVLATTTALEPQWFGGESTTDDFVNVGDGKAYVSTILAGIQNVQPIYQDTSNSESSNSNTLNKYIWWITKNPVKFLIGSFEIPSGPWSDTCDPNSYAIITKTITTVMEDGITESILHYYRTCPLQDLTGQTLTYKIEE